jgi:hypothetical protein
LPVHPKSREKISSLWASFVDEDLSIRNTGMDTYDLILDIFHLHGVDVDLYLDAEDIGLSIENIIERHDSSDSEFI